MFGKVIITYLYVNSETFPNVAAHLYSTKNNVIKSKLNFVTFEGMRNMGLGLNITHNAPLPHVYKTITPS